MNKTMTFLVATFLTGSVYAGGLSSGNPDLQGWAVDDPALLSAQQVDVKDLPLPFGNEDLYGAVYAEPGASTSSAAQMGTGDSYGTVLHEMDVHH